MDGGQLYEDNRDPLIKVLGDEDAWKGIVLTDKKKEVLLEFHDDVIALHLSRIRRLPRKKAALLLAENRCPPDKIRALMPDMPAV